MEQASCDLGQRARRAQIMMNDTANRAACPGIAARELLAFSEEGHSVRRELKWQVIYWLLALT